MIGLCTNVKYQQTMSDRGHTRRIFIIWEFGIILEMIALKRLEELVHVALVNIEDDLPFDTDEQLYPIPSHKSKEMSCGAWVGKVDHEECRSLDMRQHEHWAIVHYGNAVKKIEPTCNELH